MPGIWSAMKLGSRLKIVNFGQNGSKLDMDGPGGSIYLSWRVRPWFEAKIITFWVIKAKIWTWELTRKVKTSPFLGVWRPKMIPLGCPKGWQVPWQVPGTCPTHVWGKKGRNIHFLIALKSWNLTRSGKNESVFGSFGVKKNRPDCFEMTQNNLWEVPEGSRPSMKLKKIENMLPGKLAK